MILITNLEYTHVAQDDFAEINRYGYHAPFRYRNTNGWPVDKSMTVTREQIHGRRFYKTDLSGEKHEVVIGIQGDAAELLGLQYGAWEELEDCYLRTYSELDAAREAIGKKDRTIVALVNAGFWTRLKWLFTGVQ